MEKIFCKKPSIHTSENENHINNLLNNIMNKILPTKSQNVDNLFTKEDITNTIKSLDTKKAPGPDFINNKLIKLLSQGITPFLTNIFNLSIVLGYYPQPWKEANMNMLPKPNKDLKNPTNYRPLSLTSSVGKILEKLITKRTLEWANNNNIINLEQNGFRKGRNTNDMKYATPFKKRRKPQLFFLMWKRPSTKFGLRRSWSNSTNLICQYIFLDGPHHSSEKGKYI